MKDVGLRRIVESREFEWPWEATRGLLVISGASGGGDGGGGFSGETVVVQIEDMSLGELLRVSVGKAGGAGRGGEGYRNGSNGSLGKSGSVLLVPLFEE